MFVSLGGFFWLSCVVQTSKQAFWLGWCFGLGCFGIGVSWVYGSMRTVDTPIFLAVLMTTGFCALLAILHATQLWLMKVLFPNSTATLLLSAPFVWVVFEWCREWFLTGLPWLYAGYSFLNLPIAQLGAVIGVYGLSLLAALLSALMVFSLSLLQQNRTLALSLSFVFLGLIGGLSLLGHQLPAERWTKTEGTLSVAAVQSNVDQKTKWTGEQVTPTLRFFADSLTRLNEVDFVLWPEAAMTRRVDQIPSYFDDLQRLGEQRDQAIVTGILTYEQGQFYNAMLSFGSGQDEYRKQHLVPFGEYLPLDSLLRGTLAFFNISLASMVPAQSEQKPLSFIRDGERFDVAGFICYEAAYLGLVQELSKTSNFLAVISNDAWFGDSIGPHQHLQMTQMRAIENGRFLLRSTQNGISAIVNANGDIVKASAQFEPAEVIGEVTMRSGLTPFQRYSPAAIPIASLLLLLSIWAKARFSRRVII